jgi:NADP-dependent 3-hydroxy acid dehydrogenase YdfG
MSNELEGKRALIVGAYGGMAKPVALALAREGVQCALVGRDEERLASLADACADAGRPALPIVCDIAEFETIERTVSGAIDKLGGLNFLMNFAGLYALGKGHDVDLEAWDRMLDVNVRAHYHLVRHALPHINKLPGGAVIKIGSISGAYSGAGLHHAASRALDGYADALFEDVREFGTKVCTIRPGYVNTPMVGSDSLDRSLMIQPDDIVRTVLFVLTMPETACPTEITLRPQRTPYHSP